MSETTTTRHVILGAGPVGRSAARVLVEHGVRPVLVSRTAPREPVGGADHLLGDVRDRAFLDRAVPDGSPAVVYQALGLPYHLWKSHWPPLQAAVVARCEAARARLVSFENLYLYGPPGDRPFAEDDPHRPNSDKGRVRSAMARQLEELRVQGRLEVVQVRASDLFGPEVDASALGSEVFGRLGRKQTPRGLGDPDAPHSWTYIDDCGRTLAAVGLHSTPPPVVHVPTEAPRSYRQVVELVSHLLGERVSVQVTPPWLLHLVGWFDPVVREVPEMLYEFRAPFVMGDAVAREHLGLSSTPFEQAVRQTLSARGRRLAR